MPHTKKRYCWRLACVLAIIVAMAPVISGTALGQGKKPGGGGGTQPAELVYYTHEEPGWNVTCMTMLPDGSNKTPTTCGEPSHLLHGGQRWFVTRQAIPGEFYPIRLATQMFNGAQEGDLELEYRGDIDPDNEWSAWFSLEIDGDGSPNTFRWTTSGVEINQIEITGDVQVFDLFGDGSAIVSVQFASAIGHAIGEKWLCGVRKSARIELFAASQTGQLVQLTDDPTLEPHFSSLRWVPGDGGISWIGQGWIVTDIVDGAVYGDVVETGIYSVYFTDPFDGPFPSIQLVDEAQFVHWSEPFISVIRDHSWASDGNRLIYSYTDDSGFIGMGFVVVDFVNQSEVDIPLDRAGLLDWSAAGEWIAVETNHGIERIRPDGSGRQVLLANSSKGWNNYTYRGPRWAPDSQNLVFGLQTFNHRDWSFTLDVWRAKADGKSATNLTNVPQGHIAWPTAWRKN